MEFALVAVLLFVILFAIIDFGFFFYNDLQLTQVARDAARYASIGDQAGAQGAIATASLVSTTITNQAINVGSHGDEASVVLTGAYQPITPLPGLIGIGTPMNIDASARMRRE